VRPATALTLGVTALFSACTDTDPVAPPVPHAPPRVSLASGSAVEIAYHSCGLIYGDNGDFLACQLIVAYADGSTRAVASDEWYGWYGPPLVQRATWSPDAAKIAFVGSMGEVMVLTIADLGLVNLTNHPAFDHSPAWSPDGARIVFQSNRDGAEELYVMNADGSNVVRLTTGVGVYSDDAHPSWSPDGTRIAFTCAGSGKPEICVINSDGTGFAHLTSDPSSRDYDPDWSPDGARIAFISSRYNPNNGYWEPSIVVMNADGSGVTRLWTVYGGHDLDWSPDGSRIVFWRKHAGACETYGICDGDIFVMNVDGSGQALPLSGHGAAWAPVSPPLPPDRPPVASFEYRCNLLTCTFDSSPSQDDRGIVSWTWSFGDGQTSTAVSPSHTYATPGTYQVTLMVVDGGGFTDSETKGVIPDAPPNAAFGIGCGELTCGFLGSVSTDDYGIVTWHWDFGDGQSSTTPNPTHTYAAGGTYAVTLTVTDGSGSTDSETKSVNVIQLPILMSASGSVVRGMAVVDLSWSGGSATNVDVFRNGIKLVTTPNDGTHRDTLGRGKKGSFTYQVCYAGTTTCSLPVTVTF